MAARRQGVRRFAVALLAALTIVLFSNQLTSRLGWVPFGLGVAAQAPQATIAIDPDDVGGMVRSAAGPEAGVWVIAETDDLGTKYRKTVVTDDQGRYVIPDLPNATYAVWVRGYGLVDSPKVMTRPGRLVNLTAVIAPDAKAAAQYYPASYWLSMMRVPPEDQFPQPADTPPPSRFQPAGRGRAAGAGQPDPGDAPAPPRPNLIGPSAGIGGGGAGRGRGAPGPIQSQADMLFAIKNLQQRQLGSKITREIPPQIKALGITNTIEALQYGATAGQMIDFGAQGPNLRRTADWVDRIAAGEVPPAPPRPQGVERNVVITMWDVSNQWAFIHDMVASDRRNPLLNPNGKVYGAEFHNDGLVELDPIKNTERSVLIPAQVPRNTLRSFTRQQFDNPSIFWGDEVIVNDISNPNNITMDEQGRLWMSATVNEPENPPYCRDANNKFAKVDPLDISGRHVASYDPKTAQWTLIRTCFRTHHVQMSTTGPRRVYMNPSAGATSAYFGWVDIDTYEKTHNEEMSQGWCRLYFDTDGSGRPDRDHPVPGGPYSIIQNPADGSLWGAVQGTPGHLVRLSLGANPPETCVGEMYEVPFDRFPSRNPGTVSGFNPRGVDIDSNGVIWTALASSNHIASFDRRLCDKLTGPEAMTGRHCAKGWKLYSLPGPKLQGVTADIGSDFNYFAFVDRFNMLGLGRDTPMANGTISDSLMALDRTTGKIVTIRVPYPLGFYTRGMDGRIDDPNAGWKGRAIWATNGTRNIWHVETGKGTRGEMAKFQIRPDPLAK